MRPIYGVTAGTQTLRELLRASRLVDLRFVNGAVSDRILMLWITQNFKPAAILWLGCLFVSSPNAAEESPNEMALQPGYGYLLIRVICPAGERIARLDMTNLATGAVITTRFDMYKLAGQKAWMAMVAIPEGRYFWSEYEPTYFAGLEQPKLNRGLTRTDVPSSTETFEIVPGVINYAGDWVMQLTHYKRNPTIRHKMETVERLVDRYPEYIKRYEIYLSMMGKNAISLKEFLKLVQEHSNPVTE